MKKLKIIILASILGLSSPILSQENYILKGTARDSMQDKPMVGATARTSLITGGLVQSVLTDTSGKFSFSLTQKGKYSISLLSTGYNDYIDTILIEDQSMNLGTIFLAPKAQVLKEVTISAPKNIIEVNDDKIVYNVENDPLARSQTVLDILRRMPSVSVDGNDQVRMNGQVNFRVLLNGRETAMFSQNVSDALKGFPGASIVRIEVISNPSAKYDAEGIGGIINIVTKKKIEGYNGTVSTWSTTINQHVTNFNFNAKFNKIGIAVNYGTLSNLNIPSFTYSTTTSKVPSYYTSRVLDGDRNSNFFRQFGNAEISVAIDSLNTISFFGNVSGGNSKEYRNMHTRTQLSGSPAILASNFETWSRRKFPTTTIGTDFIRKFAGNPGKELSVRVNMEMGKSNADLESIERNQPNELYIINESLADNNQYTIQSDYIQPLKGTSKIEVGARMTLRRAKSDFGSMFKTSSSEDYKINEKNSDNFRFMQDIYSVYASYSVKVKNYNIRTGLRLEHTGVNGEFASSKAFARNSYLNVLPNAMVSRKFSDLFLSLSYNQRLQRPSIVHLNPFIENNDSLNISFGNPALDAQTIHVVSLQSRVVNKKTSFGFTFSGSFSNNMIVTITSFDEATGRRSSTFFNAGKDFLFNANGFLNTKFGEKWSFNLGLNFQYRRLENKFNVLQKNNGIGGNSSAGITYVLNERFNATTYIGFEQSIIDLQSSPNTIPFCGTGVNYQLIPNKFRIGLMAQNYFARYYDYTTTIRAFEFETVNTNKNRMGKMVLTMLWNFGKLKESVSKRRGVTIDDAVQ